MIVRSLAAAPLLALAFTVPADAESGLASIYGNGDGHAWSKTANGERSIPAR
jgi:hypothetical protein